MQHLLNESREELSLATQMKLREEGKRDAVKLVGFIADSSESPIKATKIKKILLSSDPLMKN